jgi:hypothetical protein
MRVAGVFLVLLVACASGGAVAPPPPADAPALPPDVAVPPDAEAVETCLATFRLDGYSIATSVWLTGSMTEWAIDPVQGAVELTKGVDGAWTGSYAFAAGSHQYKFIVDGTTWITDPTNLDVIDDGMGNTNSVLLCAP